MVLFFSGGCYRFFRLIICCEQRKNAIDYADFIHKILCDEISHRTEPRSKPTAAVLCP